MPASDSRARDHFRRFKIVVVPSRQGRGAAPLRTSGQRRAPSASPRR
jgi:hypothetical protein